VPSADRLSLMEYADEIPIRFASSGLPERIGFSSSRSDLSCHHVMIAQAIGGSVLLFVARLLPFRTTCSAGGLIAELV
jgi:hypothetical protein